jgi:hypothetical protein
MAKSLAFVYGVPIGIAAGAIGAAFAEILDWDHSAALGLLVGFASAVVIGAGIAIVETRRKYAWAHRELTPEVDWDTIEKATNVAAAVKHYLIAGREDGYLVYAPTLARPVVAGPLTVSGEYLSVVVARVDANTIGITGPKYMVAAFIAAVAQAGAVASRDNGP